MKKTNKPIAYMLYGFVGAGKTTYAKKLEKKTGAIRFTNDEWIIQLYGNNPSVNKFNEYYDRTNKLMMNIAIKCLKSGIDIILDSGFWKRENRDNIRKIIKKAGANFELHHIKTSKEIMKQRVLDRNKKYEKNSFIINEEAIKVFEKKFEPLEYDEKHIVIEG